MLSCMQQGESKVVLWWIVGEKSDDEMVID